MAGKPLIRLFIFLASYIQYTPSYLAWIQMKQWSPLTELRVLYANGFVALFHSVASYFAACVAVAMRLWKYNYVAS